MIKFECWEKWEIITKIKKMSKYHSSMINKCAS